MPSSDPQTHEKAERKGHPAATAEQLLAAMLPYGFRDLVDQTFVSPMRHQSEGLLVPELLRAVITPDQIRRLFTLWACLKLSGGHEIHEWHLTTFEFVSSRRGRGLRSHQANDTGCGKRLHRPARMCVS